MPPELTAEAASPPQSKPVRSPARARGVYYTPEFAALKVAAWAVRDAVSTVLEPSAGEGVFLGALHSVAQDRGADLAVHGVELSSAALRSVVRRGLLSEARAIRSDFLAIRPFPVDAVVGNPPYVRLRHLPAAEARRALAVSEDALGHPMDPSGSVWMPFVLHATRFLGAGGRLAFVLPYDLTYVRYARPLWRFLGESFGSLRVVRVRERLFPEILQETVLLFADGRGGQTSEIRYEVYEAASDFVSGTPLRSSVLDLADVVAGRRVFVEALLSPELRQMLAEAIEPRTVTVGDLADVRIGYVSGDKRFFHPSASTVERFGLAEESLKLVLTSSRGLGGGGVRTSGCSPERLFHPRADRALSAAERRYIGHGEAEGVDRRYKCSVRTPWFRVPGVTAPDLVLPVFAQRPLLLLNDGGFPVSNSLLCAYLRRPRDAEGLVAGWYNSLTALQLELHVHSLGGGVLILVPREVSSMRVLPPAPPPRGALAALDRLLGEDGDPERAFEWGDSSVLAPRLGLSDADIACIREGCDVLARWRTSVGLAARPPQRPG